MDVIVKYLGEQKLLKLGPLLSRGEEVFDVKSGHIVKMHRDDAEKLITGNPRTFAYANTDDLAIDVPGDIDVAESLATEAQGRKTTDADTGYSRGDLETLAKKYGKGALGDLSAKLFNVGLDKKASTARTIQKFLAAQNDAASRGVDGDSQD